MKDKRQHSPLNSVYFRVFPWLKSFSWILVKAAFARRRRRITQIVRVTYVDYWFHHIGGACLWSSLSVCSACSAGSIAFSGITSAGSGERSELMLGVIKFAERSFRNVILHHPVLIFSAKEMNRQPSAVGRPLRIPRFTKFWREWYLERITTVNRNHPEFIISISTSSRKGDHGDELPIWAPTMIVSHW